MALASIAETELPFCSHGSSGDPGFSCRTGLSVSGQALHFAGAHREGGANWRGMSDTPPELGFAHTAVGASETTGWYGSQLPARPPKRPRPAPWAAATIRSFSARDQLRRRCTEVITSTCVLVIGVVLGLLLGLAPMIELRKAVLTGACNVISAVCSSTAHTRFCFARRRRERSLVNLAAQPKAAARRGSRFGEQDGSGGLGDHEQTRNLPTRSSGSVTC